MLLSSATSSNMIFDDTFTVTQLNPHKKRFERVNRIVGKSNLYEMDLVLDINCEIYNIKQGEQIAVMISSSPYADGRGDPKDYTHDMGVSLLDQYDYVMYGKVFKVEISKADHGREPTMHIMASFGGLLMKLSGDHKHVSLITQDSNIYLFIRRVRGADK